MVAILLHAAIVLLAMAVVLAVAALTDLSWIARNLDDNDGDPDMPQDDYF